MNNEPNDSILSRPLFIVGPLRSGTTLLRLILDHHPQVNIFGEFEFSVSQAIGEKWPSIPDYKNFFKNDRAALQFGLELNDQLGYEDIQKDFLRQLHSRKPREIIGASIHSRIDLLPKLWPRARYINLYRDPRDVARSCIGMGWVGNVYYGSDYWIKTEERREYLFKCVKPENMIGIHYEDLVRSPRENIAKICGFIGIPYREEMLDIERGSSYKAPDPRFAEQWRLKLSDRDINYVENRCAERMQRQGYQLSQSNLLPPNLWIRWYLALQNRIYRAHFHIRRWGITLWFAKKIANWTRSYQLQSWAAIRINKIDSRYLK
ncbi:sulfotransferase family protein [Microbulbifer hainanensis]|uniref:sulfotransferase family protein n=1 Tax=Microbulbifer hainanensis TaxID=2735675 RepID=UPI0018666277|nr:sulfotransferase [Microbulbifer hainanensis]